MQHQHLLQMIQKKIYQIIKTSLFLLMVTKCNSQKTIGLSTSNYKEEPHDEKIWIPNKSDESFQFKIADTTVKEVNLIFERLFDDSIKILLNSQEVISRRIKTTTNLSVVNDEFKVLYSQHSNPLIEILLIEKNKKISFKPKVGFILCYIDRINGNWLLDFSNYQRMYF